MALSASLNSVDPRPVVRRITSQSSSLSVSGANYAANNHIGAIFSFTDASRIAGGFGTITTATIIDQANIIGAVDLHVFKSSVSPAADKTSVNFSDNDMLQNYIGTISFPSPTSFTNNRAVSLSAIGLTYQCTGTILYGCLVTLSSHGTFNAPTDITISLTTYQY